MADRDGDGVEDSIEATARTAMMVAMQLGEKFGRLREELARSAALRDGAAARELTARFEAERGAARAELRVVEQPEWWDRATPQDVARVIETAETWRGLDDTAQRASERIQHEVRDRYGVDVTDFRASAAGERLQADLEVTEATVLVAEADRLDRDANDPDQSGVAGGDQRVDLARELEDRATEYDRRATAGGDDTNTPEELRELASDARSQAQLYRDMDNAAPQEPAQEPSTAEAQAHRAEAGVVYDSAERRRDSAQQMEREGVAGEDVRVRMRVDASQGRAPEEAVAHGANQGNRNVRVTQSRGPHRTDRTR